MNEIDRLKEKLQIEREKNKKLEQTIREMKRTILKELDNIKDKVKDIMYLDNWR